jgi:quinolinate synthase
MTAATLELPQVHAAPRAETVPDTVQRYREMPEAEVLERIAAAKAKLGRRVVILGHHYQRDEVIRFADLRGDSFKLSQMAAERADAEFIIFCGVHFMAESADILTQDKIVILPDMSAGCSMAEMADLEKVEAAWDDLAEWTDTGKIIPVTYINSAANLKAFCGRNGGVVCTSSNAGKVLRWAFERGEKVFFFPDQHLGRNTAKALGIPLDQIQLWDQTQPKGNQTAEGVAKSKVLLWRGHCSVHQMFRPDDVDHFQRTVPGVKVLVHPECRMEVVDMADLKGSTEYIIEAIRSAPAGSQWAVGTELHLVNRLKAEHPDKGVYFLSRLVCMCSTMYRIDPAHLCWVLEGLVEGKVINRVRVPDEDKKWARVALDRMLALKGTGRID